MKWRTVALTDICRPRQWKTIPTSVLTEKGYPVFGANGIIGFYSEYNHEKPTVVITCRGATCGTVGITLPKSYITGNAMALDDLNEDQVDQKFLYYQLSRRGFRDVISGSAQPQITGQGLSTVKVNLPPLPEQKRIAAILDKADEIRRKREKAIELTDSFLRSVFLEMFGDPLRNSRRLGNSEAGRIPRRNRERLEPEVSRPTCSK
jgi:type I restriction enzyme S subunit